MNCKINELVFDIIGRSNGLNTQPFKYEESCNSDTYTR